MKKKTLAAASLLLALLMPLGATPLAVYAEGDAQTEISAVSEDLEDKDKDNTDENLEEKGKDKTDENLEEKDKDNTDKNLEGKDKDNTDENLEDKDKDNTDENLEDKDKDNTDKNLEDKDKDNTDKNPEGKDKGNTNGGSEADAPESEEKVAATVGMAPPAASTYVAWIGDKGYTTLEDAVNAAPKNELTEIRLGAGTYTLYKKGAKVRYKNLTFVGAGRDKTTWLVGPKVPDPKKFGTEYNSDYSFDVRGSIAEPRTPEESETVTFKGMTLQAGNADDYLGFAGSDHTVVDDCLVEGQTAYWGYSSATFINSTFTNPNNYVMWDYCSPVMSFDGCTFNVRSGKVINVYREASKGTQENPLILNFNNCTVNSTGGYWGSLWFGKSVLNIKDSNNVYQVNISGNNTINGVGVNSTTCSRLFQVESVGDGKPYYATVNIDGKTVWQNGKMVSHSIDTTNDKYTDGYKDGQVYKVYGDWPEEWTKDATVPHLFYRTRTVTEKCHYCNYSKPLDPETETKQAFLLRYDLNGGTEAEGVDYRDRYYFEPTDGNKATVAADPSRAGYVFAGWQDANGKLYAAGNTVTVDRDITLTAQWNKLVTVSFDLCGHGGANISSQTFVSGNKASEPTAPKEDGWVFGGWYTEKGCKYRFSFDSAVTSDITLYAKWDRVTTVVSAPVATPTPSPAPAAAATKTATVKNAAIPQTSDAFPMEGLLALLAVGAVGFGAVGWLRKKHH